MNGKKRIAVLFGGKSTEYNVSLESVSAVLKAIDNQKYEVMPIGITREGRWYLYRGDYSVIETDSWSSDPDLLSPVSLPLDSTSPVLVAADSNNAFKAIRIDYVFPVLHGKNGEDGTVQGMFELAGIPVIGCGTLSSALCMDKDRAHKLVSQSGIRIPKSVTYRQPEISEALAAIKKEFSCPLFIKPVRSGSSIGISRIQDVTELDAAIRKALQYDCEVIAEEEIRGIEVGCAIMGIEELTTGLVDEIELHSDYFDFYEKYSLETSKIHMPARIDRETEARIKETGKKIYRLLGCSGFARVDMFLTHQGEIVFNEVNTVPGMTAHSRFPNMMKGIGLSFSDVVNGIIELYIQK